MSAPSLDLVQKSIYVKMSSRQDIVNSIMPAFADFDSAFVGEDEFVLVLEGRMVRRYYAVVSPVSASCSHNGIHLFHAINEFL